jgi:hypothetical protein
VFGFIRTKMQTIHGLVKNGVRTTDTDLGLPDGITQDSQGQVDALRGAKTSPKHPDRLDVCAGPSLS